MLYISGSFPESDMRANAGRKTGSCKWESNKERGPREEVGHLADVENTLAHNLLSFCCSSPRFFGSFGPGMDVDSG